MNDRAKSKGLEELLANDQVMREMQHAIPLFWHQNPAVANSVIEDSGIDQKLVHEAAERFKRFAPWFRARFPESHATGGILESPIVHETSLTENFNELSGQNLLGSLWFKRDDLLPVSGSVKARGGIHEVLEVAERIALQENLIVKGDDYKRFTEQSVRDGLSRYGMVVGSTGNLGLSIGLVAAAFGFNTTVHMSHDARAWKKSMLRQNGVNVVEHTGDFSQAVDAGRAEAAKDPGVHFVDDEYSLSLFSGYAASATRLAGQLQAFAIPVDETHPLFVYIPCGVGGAPGGVTFGLKEVFGDSVQVILVEPTETPAMSLGIRSGLHDGISAHDLGLSGLTVADGLAVGRPSRLVGESIGELFDAFVTLSDEQILASLGHLASLENTRVEPSAAAGLSLPWAVEKNADFLASRGLSEKDLKNATHLVWFTGGSMVPSDEMDSYVAVGKKTATELGQKLFQISLKNSVKN